MSAEGGFLSDSERDRIVRATAELCAAKGYGEIDEETIAARAGLSRRRLEELFDDKEGAARAAIEAILGAVVEVTGKLLSPDRSELESYVLGIDAILELMAREPAFAQISYIAARQTMPSTLKDRLDWGSELLAAMLDRLRELSPQGEQPPRAARAALGGAEAVMRREIARGTTADLSQLVPDFVYAAAVPFVGQAEALRYSRLSRRLIEGEGANLR